MDEDARKKMRWIPCNTPAPSELGDESFIRKMFLERSSREFDAEYYSWPHWEALDGKRLPRMRS